MLIDLLLCHVAMFCQHVFFHGSIFGKDARDASQDGVEHEFRAFGQVVHAVEFVALHHHHEP